MSNVKTILLKFAGPLQSWGTGSNFESRYTDFYPSKSAVIGLVAASLGYRREEIDKIQELNELNFAVRIDQSGKLLKDYQIAKKYKNGEEERTYVTNRYYLEDAIFVVALAGDDDLIDKIEAALKSPYFQQFLGRRSVPPTADFIIGVEEKAILEALKELSWQASDWYRRKIKSDEVNVELYVDSDLLEEGQISYRKDRVGSFSQRNRQFNLRGERRLRLSLKTSIENNEDEHDAFSAIGGSYVSFKS